MSSKPLISVCIPCYNGERFIAMTVQSVLAQEFTNFELIIVDDASTDRTISVLQEFRDPRLKLIRNPRNLGIGQNWNKAVSISQGKYVKLLCGDDLMHPSCLARQVAALEANPDAVLAICNREVINSQGVVVLRRRLPFKPGMVAGQRLVQTSVRWGSNLIGEPAVGLFRSAVLNRNVQYDASNPYLIDLAFWSDVLRHGDAYIDLDCLAAFRISTGAVSAQIGFKQARAFRRFVVDLRNDGFYHISTLDLVLGYSLSFQWCFLRNLFVRFKNDRSRTPEDGCSAGAGGAGESRREYAVKGCGPCQSSSRLRSETTLSGRAAEI